MAYRITDACIGCTLCTKVCPVMAISGTLKQRHSINPKRCVECGVCGRACAKSAVVDTNGITIERIPRKDWDKPLFDASRCSACHLCVQTCTAGAIDISMPTYKGDLRVAAYLAAPAKCVGCALCVAACPMDAIAMQDNREAK